MALGWQESLYSKTLLNMQIHFSGQVMYFVCNMERVDVYNENGLYVVEAQISNRK
jgi:hypothetical protein